MQILRYELFPGKSNITRLPLRLAGEDGNPESWNLEENAVTRVDIRVGSKTISSQDGAGIITWMDDVISAKLSAQLPLDFKPSIYPGRITVFNAVYPAGLVWSDNIEFLVN